MTGAGACFLELPQNFGETSGLANVDLRIQREFSLGESKKFVFSWEAFNLFNRTNFTRFAGDAFDGTANDRDIFRDGNLVVAGCARDANNRCAPGTRIVLAEPDTRFLSPTATSNTLSGAREMQWAFKYIW